MDPTWFPRCMALRRNTDSIAAAEDCRSLALGDGEKRKPVRSRTRLMIVATEHPKKSCRQPISPPGHLTSLDTSIRNRWRKGGIRVEFGTDSCFATSPTTEEPVLSEWSANQKLITDITPEGRYSQGNSWGIYCVRFAHSSDIFPDVDDLRGAVSLPQGVYNRGLQFSLAVRNDD